MKSFTIATGLPMGAEVTSILYVNSGFETKYINEEGEEETQFTYYPNDPLFDEVEDEQLD